MCYLAATLQYSGQKFYLNSFGIFHSRMRSEGFLFLSWGLRGGACSRRVCGSDRERSRVLVHVDVVQL